MPPTGDTAGITEPPEETGPVDSSPPAEESGEESAAESVPPEETGETAEPPPPLAGPHGLLVAQDWNHEAYPTGAGAGRYRVIFLQEGMYTLLTDIRAANPEARLLAYQKVGGMRSDGGDHPSTGVQVDEAPEAWFLHDGDGNRLE